MTSDKILDDIRDNVIGDFSRHHLVDKQDLANIKRSFGLDDVQRHDNDQDSVLSWIKEWESSDENPVLYYKLQVLQFLIKCFFFLHFLKESHTQECIMLVYYLPSVPYKSKINDSLIITVILFSIRVNKMKVMH